MAKPDPKVITLYGYSRPIEADKYMAVCLTLNLVTEGRTQREALHKLHSLIKAYLDDAFEDGQLEQFVPRRAPLRFYAEYIGCRAIHAFVLVLTMF